MVYKNSSQQWKKYKQFLNDKLDKFNTRMRCMLDLNLNDIRKY